MYLKKIVVNGFKSFADKIVISLDKGITGIVGPNGSGKSNVIDSVRWVMGEQNAKNLRGEKATDIIFAGSERRKALGLAEVSLVFDNTEDAPYCPPEYRHEPEITLTRRLYADGQREYLINKKPCRLKDIVGFFSSTGLGGRSYSMIQQGQVDRILNAKPEDIREILEEAAGTAGYKKRKGEAQKKLEDTQLNLSRIEDILLEVEKHLDSLVSQVEKAKEYKELSEKLRTEEMSLFAHNYHHFKTEKDAISEKLEAERAAETETMAQIAGFEARHTELQAQMDDADPEIQALNEKLTIARVHIAEGEMTIKSSLERLDGGTRRIAALVEELAEDDANLKVLESQVEGARTELSKAESLAQTLKEAIESFEHEVESADEAAQVYQSRMDEFEDEIRNLERLIEGNKFRSEAAEQEAARTRTETAAEAERLAQLKSEIVGVAEELAVATERAGSSKAGLDQDIKTKHDAEAAVAQHYRDAKAANVRRDALREKYHGVRARYESLAELEAGATDVAGAMAKLKEEVPDVAAQISGLLTDFLSFNDAAKELSPTAKGAFERWAERIVIPDLEQLNQLVRAAQRVGTGAMPVVILSQSDRVDQAQAAAWASRHGAEPMERYLKVDDGAGSESRVGADAIGRLVKRLYLLPTLALESDTVESIPPGVVAFTSQGVTFAAGGEVAVGGKAAGGILSRKTEMEALAAELKGVESDLAKTQTEIDDLELKVNENRQIIAEVDAKLQRQNKDVLEVMQALQAVQQVHDRKQELIDASAAAHEKLAATGQRLAEERETLAKNRAALDKELATARDELTRIEQEAESLVERKEETRRLHEAKKVDLVRSEARAQATREGYVNIKAQLELLQNKLSRRYEERSRLEQDVAQAKLDQERAKGDVERYVRERDQLQEEYAIKREANAGVIEELRVIDSRLKGLRDNHNAMQRSLTEKNLAFQQLTIAIATNIEQAAEKYHVDLSTYEFEREANFNASARSGVVTKLRNKIEGMGAINMMALEEYQEKGARRDFIVKQRDEVVASIGLLQAAIEEIEETSLQKFMETYEKVNLEFGSLFPILFPTGEGKLELTQPDNLLESGLEIMCRLPGKSKKPMTLFSGGEKALTAMALIFALLKTKPTPYCFLDEVDAPLDEANVGRYNRVLEALSSQFQFVVITHNRRTMEVLDTLYGITMQEPGVSKVVGVDMQKDLPAHLRKAFKEEGPAKVPAPTSPSAAVLASAARPVEGATAQ
jgi:chromosome segregation protein